METYTYVNIFDTKGLEYILLICFLMLFILFARYLSASSKERKNDLNEAKTVSLQFHEHS